MRPFEHLACLNQLLGVVSVDMFGLALRAKKTLEELFAFISSLASTSVALKPARPSIKNDHSDSVTFTTCVVLVEDFMVRRYLIVELLRFRQLVGFEIPRATLSSVAFCLPADIAVKVLRTMGPRVLLALLASNKSMDLLICFTPMT